MTYERISLEQAKKLGSFFAPGVTEQKYSNEYWYYICYEEDSKNIAGAAALDPSLEVPRLLSIGVSDEKLRQGIGTGLLDVLMTDIGKAFYAKDISDPPSIRYENCLPEAEWKIPDLFFVRNGFVLRDIGTVSSVSYQDITANETLNKARARFHSDRIKTLKDIPGGHVRSFGQDIVKRGLYPGIHSHELDQDTTVFYTEGDEIKGCVLMRRMNNGSLMNQWVYLDNSVSDRTVLLQMFVLCAQKIEKLDIKDGRVYFMPVNEAGAKLTGKLLPTSKADSQIRLYDKETLPDKTPVFEQVTENEMCCRGCIYSMNNALECEKYIRKPGTVLYGGECKFRSEG